MGFAQKRKGTWWRIKEFGKRLSRFVGIDKVLSKNLEFLFSLVDDTKDLG